MHLEQRGSLMRFQAKMVGSSLYLQQRAKMSISIFRLSYY